MSSPRPPSSPNLSSNSSSRYRVEEIVTTVRIPVVRPKPAFLKVLQEAGGTGEVYIMPDIIDLVRKYVEARKLYDENDPRIVYCQNDLLGEALNVTSFTLNEALKLFWDSCTLTPDSCMRIKRQVVTNPVKSEKSPEKDKPLSNTSAGPISSDGVSASVLSMPEIAADPEPPHENVISLTASQPSTSITQLDIDKHEQEQKEKEQVQQDSTTSNCSSTLQASLCEDEPKPSTSFSVMCDEADSWGPPWSCEVMVKTHEPSSQQRVRNDSLVVECISDSFSVEYELVSSSDAELVPDLGDCNESEGSSSNHERTEVYVVCQESDIEYLADYSDSNSDSDAELSNEDKWQCNMCKFKNCALYRNCEKCWSIRPDWLPAPRNSGKIENSTKNMSYTQVDDKHESESFSTNRISSKVSNVEVPSADLARSSSIAAEKASMNQSQDFPHSQDSAIGSLVSSQEPLGNEGAAAFNQTNVSLNLTESSKSHKPLDVNEEETKPASQKHKRDSASDWSDSNEAANYKKSKKKIQRSSQQPHNKDTDQKPLDPCVICWTHSKTASIIHGKTGHQACCYRCAKRLKQQRKSCPICRKPIQKVIRNFL